MSWIILKISLIWQRMSLIFFSLFFCSVTQSTKMRHKGQVFFSSFPSPSLLSTTTYTACRPPPHWKKEGRGERRTKATGTLTSNLQSYTHTQRLRGQRKDHRKLTHKHSLSDKHTHKRFYCVIRDLSFSWQALRLLTSRGKVNFKQRRRKGRTCAAAEKETQWGKETGVISVSDSYTDIFFFRWVLV